MHDSIIGETSFFYEKSDLNIGFACITVLWGSVN